MQIAVKLVELALSVSAALVVATVKSAADFLVLWCLAGGLTLGLTLGLIQFLRKRQG